MYDLYFGDEKSMPCSKQRRFKNFYKKKGTGASQQADIIELEPDLPVIPVPEDIVPVIQEEGITEKPFSLIRSEHSSRSGKGDALAIAFPSLMAVMWRKEDEPYSVVQVHHSDFADITAEVDEVDDDLITVSVITEEKTYRLWYSMSQSEEVVEFVNGWKLHLVHNLNKEKPDADAKKAEVKKEPEPVEEPEEKKPDIHSSAKMAKLEKEESAVVSLENEEPVPPEIEGANQYELPKTIIFGTLLLDQLADGNNMTEQDLELVHMTLGNPELLALCIQNFKQVDIYDVIDVIRDTFTPDQKLMLMTNLADLAYRNGEPHENELKDLEHLALEINMLLVELKRILNIFRVKNDPEILNS